MRRNTHRLYRDPSHSWLGGVCAGIANYSGLPLLVVRVLAVLLLLSTGPIAVLTYIIMVFAVPKEPRDLYASPDAREFFQDAHREPVATIGQIRQQMRRVEHRLQRMEAYVTSTQFELDQGLRGRR